MSPSILEALYNGDLNPGERPYNSNPKRKRLNEKIETEREYFVGKMPPDDYQRFQALEGLQIEAAIEDEARVYSYGFALGTLLMVEVMERRDAMMET